MTAPNGCETAPEGRAALIEQLEEIGYDVMADTPEDWRESKSDAELLAAIEAFDGPAGAANADVQAVEPPDISEIVAVIRDVVQAASNYQIAHPDEAKTIRDETGELWIAAFGRLQTLLTEIDASLEAFRE